MNDYPILDKASFLKLSETYHDILKNQNDYAIPKNATFLKFSETYQEILGVLK